MTNRLVLSLVLGANDESGSIEITGRTDAGEVVVVFPADSAAMLSAFFASAAGSLQSGATKRVLHPQFVVHGYELLEPKENQAGLLLKCLPDLNLWFALPVGVLDELGKTFRNAAQIAKRQSPGRKSN